MKNSNLFLITVYAVLFCGSLFFLINRNAQKDARNGQGNATFCDVPERSHHSETKNIEEHQQKEDNPMTSQGKTDQESTVSETKFIPPYEKYPFKYVSKINPKMDSCYNNYNYNLNMKREPLYNVTIHKEEIRKDLDAFVDKINRDDKPHFSYEPGTIGFVTSCQVNAFCLFSLHMLVDTLDDTIPIEFWAENDTETLYNVSMIQKIFGSRISVRYHNETEEAYEEYIGKLKLLYPNFYHRKLHAMVMSRFQKVVWIDGDANLIRDPLPVFEDERVRETGTMLLRDKENIMYRNFIWELLDLPARSNLSGEGSLIFIDKEKAWKQLYVAAYMNQNQNVFYRMIHGDKDTIAIASEFLKLPYFLMPYLLAPIGFSVGHSFVQPGPDGFSLLVHFTCDGKKEAKKYLNMKSDPYTTIMFYDPDISHAYGYQICKLGVKKDHFRAQIKTVSAREVFGNEYVSKTVKMYQLAASEFKELYTRLKT